MVYYYECSVLWTWSVMNTVCYERGLLWTALLWTWTFINVACYERVCYERSLLWMWSVMNGSVMKSTALRSCKNVATFFLCCTWQLYLAHVVEYLSENFSTMGYCFFYSTFYSLIQYVTVKHITISFHSLLSLAGLWSRSRGVGIGRIFNLRSRSIRKF